MSRAARAIAPARVCLGSSSSAESAAVVHAHATTLHDACNLGRASGLLPVQRSTSYSLFGGRQGPTGTSRVKRGVSAEDLRRVSEVEAGVNVRPAGGVRRQVADPLSRKATRHKYQEGQGTDTQFVSPGRGLGIRQSMGWTKVCETVQSGIWVQKSDARARMFPDNLDHSGGMDLSGIIRDCLGHARARLSLSI